MKATAAYLGRGRKVPRGDLRGEKRKQKTQQQQKTQAKIRFTKILTPISHAFQLEKKLLI